MAGRLYMVVFFSFILISFKGNAQNETIVKGVTFSGNQNLSNVDLKSQINTRPKTFFERIIFWKPAPKLNSLILEDDINRIRNYYIRNGYPVVNISQEVLLIRDGKKAEIKIIIDEIGRASCRERV